MCITGGTKPSRAMVGKAAACVEDGDGDGDNVEACARTTAGTCGSAVSQPASAQLSTAAMRIAGRKNGRLAARLAYTDDLQMTLAAWACSARLSLNRR